MKIDVDYIFLETHVDPIYNMIGLNADAEEVQVLKEGVLDLSEVAAAYASYDCTEVVLGNGQVFYIDLHFTKFRKLWLTV